ncbi:MAG: hypothetical protein WB424_07360 [Terracidiphilus sp.]
MKQHLSWLALLILLTASGALSQLPSPSPATKPPSAGAPSPAPTDPWIGVRFLIGSWESKTTGGMAQAKASAGYTFRFELRQHILARHTRSGACLASDDFDCQHSDLLYIFPASNGSSLQAIYFDNEGHVIHYDVTEPTPNSVMFLSDPAQPGPQYRLSYEIVDGTLSGKFEIKMPSEPDFQSYLEWSGKRR